jgi:DNA polymerase I-like protein with 3'-5' exonuclease and polymerase domains
MKMIVAVDLETSCGVPHCPGFGLSNSSKCEHAVHFRQNKIDIIGVYDGRDYIICPSPSDFDRMRADRGWKIVFHGGKFDYKTLKAKGSKLVPRDVVGDTQLLGSCVSRKIPAKWLKTYNEKRKELNASLPAKQRHRVGTPLSLKTMAPYYLGVEPFWENPVSHDDPEYNRKDCEYTHRLYTELMAAARQDDTLRFYESYLVPWQKLLAEAEYEGVLIDEKLLHKMYGDACKELVKLEAEVHALVGEAFGKYRIQLESDLRRDSEERLEKYCQTRLKDQSKRESVASRYEESLAAKIAALPTQFNLASSQQMLVILTHFGIDTAVEKRDKATNEWIEKEGTDKYVLKRAKVTTNNGFAAQLLKYREKETEVSYLKQYINACVDGRIYCSFSITGTRTGRLSSSGPNLQNVKGALRVPFIIADPERYLIYTVDSSQIEPRVIAYLTGDRELVILFQQGRDYHNYATKKFFPVDTQGVEEKDIKKTHQKLRKTAKIGDLSILYGTGKFTFQTMLLVREEMALSLEECDKMVKDFRAGMQSINGWKINLENQYKRGTAIYDRFGALVQARDESSVHMTLFNTFVQGMASKMIFHASLMAYREFMALGIDAKPLLWVHDEVCWRFPKEHAEFCKKVVDKHMTSYKLETQHGRVPLDIEGNLSSCWQK